MTKRELFSVLLVMILLILLTTRSVPSAASTGASPSKTEVDRLGYDAEAASNPGHEPAASPSKPKTAVSSGGGSLNLIK